MIELLALATVLGSAQAETTTTYQMVGSQCEIRILTAAGELQAMTRLSQGQEGYADCVSKAPKAANQPKAPLDSTLAIGGGALAAAGGAVAVATGLNNKEDGPVSR